MKVVVTGLAAREEAVLGFFFDRTLPSWTWKSAPADRQTTLPKADLYVLDLAALGLARGSEAAEADLLNLLHGTPAVLLLAASDSSWSAIKARTTAHALVWLAKPYGTQDMQAALKQAAALVRPAAVTVTGKPAPAAVVPPVARPRVAPAPPPEVALPETVAVEEVEENSLTPEQLSTRLAALHDGNRLVFLRQLSDMLTLNRPFEARFTVQNSLIVHPEDGWIATNTPMLVIQRVCQSDAMASAVSMREIEGAQAEERAQRLGMPPRELDVFLWELMASLS